MLPCPVNSFDKCKIIHEINSQSSWKLRHVASRISRRISKTHGRINGNESNNCQKRPVYVESKIMSACYFREITQPQTERQKAKGRVWGRSECELHDVCFFCSIFMYIFNPIDHAGYVVAPGEKGGEFRKCLNPCCSDRQIGGHSGDCFPEGNTEIRYEYGGWSGTGIFSGDKCVFTITVTGKYSHQGKYLLYKRIVAGMVIEFKCATSQLVVVVCLFFVF